MESGYHTKSAFWAHIVKCMWSEIKTVKSIKPRTFVWNYLVLGLRAVFPPPKPIMFFSSCPIVAAKNFKNINVSDSLAALLNVPSIDIANHVMGDCNSLPRNSAHESRNATVQPPPYVRRKKWPLVFPSLYSLCHKCTANTNRKWATIYLLVKKALLPFQESYRGMYHKRVPCIGYRAIVWVQGELPVLETAGCLSKWIGPSKWCMY